jgi:hypothetical protein
MTMQPGESDLFSIPARVSSILPETVRDRDGNDVELLGVLTGPLGLTGPMPSIVLLTGRIVREAPKKEAP